MKRELTVRDYPFVAAGVLLLLLLVGFGFSSLQNSSANQEQQRMIVQMNLEMGKSADSSTESPPEHEEQSDPNFKP